MCVCANCSCMILILEYVRLCISGKNCLCWCMNVIVKIYQILNLPNTLVSLQNQIMNLTIKHSRWVFELPNLNVTSMWFKLRSYEQWSIFSNCSPTELCSKTKYVRVCTNCYIYNPHLDMHIREYHNNTCIMLLTCCINAPEKFTIRSP